MSTERDTAADMPDETEASSENRSRGLWGLMRSTPHPAEAPRSDDETPLAADNAEPIPVADEDEATESRSLWSVMGVPPVDVAPVDVAPVNETDSDPAPKGIDASPRGLWSVMSAPPAETKDGTAEEDTTEDNAIEEPVEEALEGETAEDFESAPIDTTPFEMPAPMGTVSSETAVDPSAPRRSFQVVLCLLAGLTSVPLAGLAYYPQFAWKLPATAIGFGSLAVGLLAWNEIGRSRGRRTGRPFAAIGMLLGTVGMFLGPMVITPLGQNMRMRGDRYVAIEKETAIGKALLRYHGEHERFPAGGNFVTGDDGRLVPMHGWMTTLLPYLGENALHRSVHFDQPYDAPANQPVFTRDVEAFLSAGGSRRKLGRGLAVTHFAGVGGRALFDEQVGLVDLGIFDRNSNVTFDHITDGSSQTFIVGEVGTNFAPWGDPENWRLIGRGLNRELSGFGNADASGAVFLRADGSAKFYSNKISRRVLERLSTRNGEDRFSREAIP